MKLKAKKIDNVVIISIEGDLDAKNGPELAQFFKDQMDDSMNFIADFSKVEFISSAGLRVLLVTLKEARRQGGDLRLAAIQKNVDKVLTISGFTRIIRSYKNVEEAIKSYSE
jgi:anti-sigma B factor antagonist